MSRCILLLKLKIDFPVGVTKTNDVKYIIKREPKKLVVHSDARTVEGGAAILKNKLVIRSSLIMYVASVYYAWTMSKYDFVGECG